MSLISFDTDSEEGQARELANEIQHAFSRSKIWEYEKLLGNGGYGVTVLLRDKDPLRLHNRRRVVLKRSLFPHLLGVNLMNSELVKEIDSLKMLRGNSHHAQMLAYCEDVAQLAANANRSRFRSRASRIFARVRSAFRNPPATALRALSHLGGPAILLEYLENGTLLQLQNRLVRDNVHLPNRLLWRWLRKIKHADRERVVRGCIGLAYPPNGPEGAPLVLEKIPPNTPASKFIHGDLAGRNIMIGDRDLEVPEHRLVPQLKMIDFGSTTEVLNSKQAVTDNLYRVSRQILCLINRQMVTTLPWNAVDFNGITTLAHDILPENGVDKFPNLDIELRDLIVEAMATDIPARPSLREMFRRTRQGMLKPPSAYPGRVVEESDYPIQMVMQQLLYNA
ncbi:hypothetical protein HD806DRAFT_544217 [Xylariaceae sp. AK1471]|nr:hypothetical protein HD806DRAFT_544217 [Xylariaceae sp. AK1471]